MAKVLAVLFLLAAYRLDAAQSCAARRQHLKKLKYAVDVGCLTKKQAEVVHTVEFANVECLAKYAWLIDLPITEFNGTVGQYNEIFGFNPPPSRASVAIDERCIGNVEHASTQGYELVLWYCLNFCEHAARKLNIQSAGKYPLTDVSCEKESNAHCDTPVQCKCSFVDGTSASMNPPAVIREMADAFNGSCLSCYYHKQAPTEKCISPNQNWQELYQKKDVFKAQQSKVGY